MTHLGTHFERALTYALHVHGGHVRKGTNVPYFSHLMGVAATVIENRGTEVEAIAALLHDAVEDQGGRPRLDDIRDRFGPEVADIVEACTDSLDSTAGQPKEDWLPRKRKYLSVLATKAPSILSATVADKLHNARAIYRDAKSGGPELWSRFGKPAEQTIAYYSALYGTIRHIHLTPVTAELARPCLFSRSSFKIKGLINATSMNSGDQCNDADERRRADCDGIS
jgi:(p)ppGpp synthase/HD superfamily hydrolase